MVWHWTNTGVLLIGPFRKKFRWNLNQDEKNFIQVNEHENGTCKISAILSQPQCINPHSPSTAYMCQWIRSALVQIMACRLFGAKPLSKPMLFIVNWTLRNKIGWNFNKNTKRFIHENASETITLSVKWWLFCPEGDELNHSPIYHSITMTKVDRDFCIHQRHANSHLQTMEYLLQIFCQEN